MMGLGKLYTSLEISAYKQTRVSESRARKKKKKTLEFLNISDFERGSLRVSDFTILSILDKKRDVSTVLRSLSNKVK